MIWAVTAIVCTFLICLSIDKIGYEMLSCLRALISIQAETKSLLRQVLDETTTTRRLYHD